MKIKFVFTPCLTVIQTGMLSGVPEQKFDLNMVFSEPPANEYVGKKSRQADI